MGKKSKATKETPAKMVGVPYLSEKFGEEGRLIRIHLRRMGLSAPAVTEQEGFGPRSKYSWAEGSKELADIEAALEKSLTGQAAKAKAEKAGKKSKKLTADEAGKKQVEELEDEDEDEAVDVEDDDDDEVEDDEDEEDDD